MDEMVSKMTMVLCPRMAISTDNSVELEAVKPLTMRGFYVYAVSKRFLISRKGSMFGGWNSSVK